MAQEHEAQAGPESAALPAEVALARLAQEREAQLAPLRAELGRLQQQLAELEARHAQLRREALEAHRRALVAEHRGQVVEDLIRGETREELEASVARARAAWEAVAQAVRQEALARVPPGAAPAPAPELPATPLGKIAAALRARA